MMATTHGLVGMALGLLVFPVAPELGSLAVWAGLVGGIAPDLDLYARHRRTLHFPVVGTAIGAFLLVLALAAPNPLTVAVGVGVLAAGTHAMTDVLGGSLELRPWERRAERAVYSHYHRRWIEARRYVAYDGAPEDLLVAGLVALPVLVVASPAVSTAVGLLLLVSFGYVLVRRRLPDVAIVLATRAPSGVRQRVPRRYLGDLQR